MKRNRLRLWGILTALCVAMIFLQSALPASASHTESTGVLAFVQSLLPWVTHNLLRKAAHFTEFLLFGFALTKTFRYAKNFYLLKPLAFGLLTALCDETLQLYIPGRSGQITDVWVDFAGALTGALLVWLFYKLRRK